MLAYQRSIIMAINSSDGRDGDGKIAALVLANDTIETVQAACRVLDVAASGYYA
jgi:hypothetical protein